VVFTLADRQEQVQFGSEQEFTAALLRLTHPEQRKLYFVIGHGENDLADTAELGYSRIKASLERQNFTIETLNTLVTSTVPSDAVALIVAGPQVAITAEEMQAISQYLDGGGAALFLLNPTLEMREGQGEADQLTAWLASAWGIAPANDLVVDPASSQVTDPFTPVSVYFGPSPITDKLVSQALPVAFRLARSVGTPVAGDPAFANVQVSGLVFTSEQAWGEVDFADLQTSVQMDPTREAAGPLNMAVSGENLLTQARVVVFGDSDFISNSGIDLGANNDIFVASVNWATGNTDLISIPPKEASFRPPLDLSTRTIATLGIVSVLLLPFGVLVVGIAVVLNRRARYK
jgi:ABC-type uncharacterized transport system involved in gliding motility auxiliary subunit